jgi:phosphatidylglycerol:prolipoprotein diacylglycerol transferase
MNVENVLDASLYALLAGIIGARLLFLLLESPEHGFNLSLFFRIWEGGLSFHGGLLGAIAAVATYTRIKKIPFLAMADVLAPSLAIGYAFTRIGCFLNGCCYGSETHLPWAVGFVDPITGGHTPPSHPAQLYAFAANLAIFGILTLFEKKSRGNGYVFFVYLALYSVYRFLIEIVRKGVTATVFWNGLTQAQVLSLVLLAAVIIVIAAGYRHRKVKDPESLAG